MRMEHFCDFLFNSDINLDLLVISRFMGLQDLLNYLRTCRRFFEDAKYLLFWGRFTERILLNCIINSDEIYVDMRVYANIRLIEMGKSKNWWESCVYHRDSDVPAITFAYRNLHAVPQVQPNIQEEEGDDNYDYSDDDSDDYNYDDDLPELTAVL
jgi:hypothetical protein